MRETYGFVGAVAENLLDRLEDCRKAFPSALCLGVLPVPFVACSAAAVELRSIMMDMSADMVRKWRESENATDDGPERHFVVGDEEFLPIKERYGHGRPVLAIQDLAPAGRAGRIARQWRRVEEVAIGSSRRQAGTSSGGREQ
ncbi:hypothetical protein C2845_PM15G03510 [Panicum miliaceum]|uniref:Uncharacterized protein n=1 Tax=Panicum miliaceum TaxID=4540 RepID=A0A3L6Q920_PANMI|nr:hypothetical protein C2845_PM15G03510 [Panicum miliaceum]